MPRCLQDRATREGEMRQESDNADMTVETDSRPSTPSAPEYLAKLTPSVQASLLGGFSVELSHGRLPSNASLLAFLRQFGEHNHTAQPSVAIRGQDVLSTSSIFDQRTSRITAATSRAAPIESPPMALSIDSYAAEEFGQLATQNGSSTGFRSDDRRGDLAETSLASAATQSQEQKATKDGWCGCGP